MSFYPSSTLLAELTLISPNDCISMPVECSCLTKEGLDKISLALTDKKKCELALESKSSLIETQYLGSTQTIHTPFWQEPSFIVSGFVVSFSVGGLLTYFLTR